MMNNMHSMNNNLDDTGMINPVFNLIMNHNNNMAPMNNNMNLMNNNMNPIEINRNNLWNQMNPNDQMSQMDQSYLMNQTTNFFGMNMDENAQRIKEIIKPYEKK